MLNVLYVQHVGVPGGSARSLFGMIEQLSSSLVRPHIVSQRGPVADAACEKGYPCIQTSGLSQFDNAAQGSYRGKRWIVLVRELWLICPTMLVLWKARRMWGQKIDLIHVNEYSLLPTGLFAKWLFRKPLVLHVRALQDVNKRRRQRLMARLARKYVDRLVAIDNAVAESVGGGAAVTVIHNGDNIPEVAGGDRRHARDGLRVGLVANFLAYKGLEEFIEAARICINDRQLTDLRFSVFGDSQQNTSSWRAQLLKLAGFRHDVKAETLARVEQERLASHVMFRGFVSDVQSIYRDIDVLCFPSRLDAVGRPVFEAAIFGRPSIVSLRTRTTDDAIMHGTTGLVVPERDPTALADAIEYFYRNPPAVDEMGAAARNLAVERFDVVKNARRLGDVYRQIVQLENRC